MPDTANLTSKQKKVYNPYFYLVIAILAFLVSGFAQYMMQPILVYMMELMGINEAQSGFMTSARSITMIIIAIPMGVAIGKLGPRKTGIFGISIMALSILIGAFATRSYPLMLVSVLIGGIGSSAIGLMLPYVIAVIFKPEMRGKANGWYITSGTFAQLIMYNLIPRITNETNITPAWWVVFAYVSLC